MWQKIEVDIVHMPPDYGKNYMVVCRDDFSGWVKARALKEAKSEAMADFLYQDVFCRWEVPSAIVINKGPENRPLKDVLLDKYSIETRIISPYHAPSNGMTENGYKSLKNGLSKLTGGTGKGWVRLLPSILWADRVTVKRSMGFTPFYMNMRRNAVLPIKLSVPTWQTMNWTTVQDTAGLLAMQARQIDGGDLEIEEALAAMKRTGEQNKEYFDAGHSIYHQQLDENDLVLLHNTGLSRVMSSSHKLFWRGLGPYGIEKINIQGSYRLAELDGTPLCGMYNGNRLKKFFSRDDALEASASLHENMNVPQVDILPQLQTQAQHAISDGGKFAVVIPGVGLLSLTS